MTTASAGPSGFHTKHYVAAFAVAGFMAAILVIAQWLGSDSRPVLPPTDQAAPEAAAAESSVSANWEALAAGKFDDAPAPSAPATAAIESVPEAGTSANWINYRDGKFEDTGTTAAVESGPEIVRVTGTSANFDALLAGKYDLDSSAGGPGVIYERIPAVEFGTSGNFQNYNDGKFEDAEAQPRTYERAVSGGHQPF